MGVVKAEELLAADNSNALDSDVQSSIYYMNGDSGEAQCMIMVQRH